MFSLRRLGVLAATLTLVPLGVVTTSGAGGEPSAATAPAAARAAAPAKARAAKKTSYDATIRVTKHGIPHITAKSFGDLGFGSGYAAADASICTLADTLVTGRGQRSRWFGADGIYNDQVTLLASNLQVDAFVTDLHNRRAVEKLLKDKVRGPGPQAKAMVRGYTAGVNAWLKKIGGPKGVSDPECKGAPHLKQKARPIDLWYGVYLANMLGSNGVFVKEIVDAAPPGPNDPGLPNPTRASVDRDELLAGLGKDPASPFGSNATAIGGDSSTTGRGMLLGNPHFPWRGRYHFTQQHLTIPGKYDVAGASLVGSPVVNIGWNKDVAWSHTVSTAYRFTPYEYRLAGLTTYVTDKGPQALERREVTITVKNADGSLGTVTEDLYRTPEGYVIDAPKLFMPWSTQSVWAIRDANAEQLRTVDTFLEMGKATNVRDLLRRQDKAGGMPWVNTTAADRNGDVAYADHSVVPHVSNAVAQNCMTPTGRLLFQLANLPGLDGTRAGSSCAWGDDADASRPGIFGPANLPMAVRRDWVTNANDSYWLPNIDHRLEGFATIIGCEKCARTMRTRVVNAYVMDRLASGKKESPKSLRDHEHENRLMTAEVMRANGDFDRLCSATGETEACAVLKAWDGTSNIESRGTHLFEAFMAEVGATRAKQVMWRTPFNAADPQNTPRDLNFTSPELIKALRDAIAKVRAAGVALDATWGSLQVAGDRGAPPIPLGGGTGDSVGNANALASRWPLQNADKYRPITYGSSHIQAISFLDRGRVDARTILTYSQYEDPTSKWSTDQTRMFSKKKWVHFAFTKQQIRRETLRTIRVRG
ncbi:penicillin acylase family protein [Nocardioides sp.]|uniref:penicillin acylase family protein n=1 Tax=Nocardioides sp. TaxID=35761 RepID=UPI00356399B5